MFSLPFETVRDIKLQTYQFNIIQRLISSNVLNICDELHEQHFQKEAMMPLSKTTI